ncbi:hypothetical protein B5S28_g2071 [[Candida] boidinii]|nr:hypothetical protein B5S28_g2071 [[Candida] boidinii]OWB62290.1 hypothetical protein B5S29_g3214 [[Candida] boidinii]
MIFSRVMSYAGVSRNYQLASKKLGLSYDNLGLIISDWDDTITARDTIGLIFRAIKKVKPDSEYDADHFISIYKTQHDLFLDSKKDFLTRDTVTKEIEYQKQVKAVELSSVNEMIKVKYVENIPKSTFIHECDEVKIKSGFSKFFDGLLNQNSLIASKSDISSLPFIVLSVNWTSCFIEEYFEKHFNIRDMLDKETFKIICNEFEFDDSTGLSTGNILDYIKGINDENFVLKDIRTGYDKLLVTEYILNRYKMDKSNKRSVYLGDSATDVLSMIKCGKGIIMRNGNADATLKRLGFKVTDIADLTNNNDDDDDSEIDFLLVDNWFDLHSILTSVSDK